MIATRVWNALAQPTEFNRICVQKTPAPVILCKWASWICDGDRNTNIIHIYAHTHSKHRQKTEKSNTQSASGLASGGPNERASQQSRLDPSIISRDGDGFVAIFAIGIYIYAVCIYLLIAHNHFAIALPAIYPIMQLWFLVLLVRAFHSFFFSMSCGFDVNFDSIHFLYKHKSYVNCHAMVIIENHENTVCKCLIYI